MGSGTDLSMSAKSSRNALPHAHPAPAYVSENEAEELLYAEIELPVKIAEGAISLLNGFLDQVLYDILSKSHSTALTAVRSVVPVVLRQRLGRSAVKAADEELQDYLDEDEMDEVLNAVGVLDPAAEFDPDLAWRLTRLRCMVYAKLGNMEEEDEEEYLEDEDLRDHVNRVKEAVRSSATIAPPSAIFLTTVLEFLAEQALCIAAAHSRKRHMSLKDSTRETDPQQSHLDQDVIVLEEIDMSGIAKEGPLIRLWRSWKGNVRTAGSMSSRPTTPSIMSPASPESPTYEWRFPPSAPISTIQEERSPSVPPTRSPFPADVPLPMTDNDVEEIEVPGLARAFDEEEDETNDQRPRLEKRRASSMLFMPGHFPDPLGLTPTAEPAERPSWNRRRSHSVPTSGRGSSDRQTRDETVRESAAPNGMNDTEDAKQKDLEASRQPAGDAIQSPKDQGRSSLRSSVISDTVATIAGALSVEAWRASRRDRSAQDQNATDDFEQTQMHPPAPGSEATETAVQYVGADPEDLALSSADERDAVDNDPTNPRDSGFGVAAPSDELPIHDQTATTNGEQLFVAHHNQEHIHDDRNAAEAYYADGGSRTRSPNDGYAIIHQPTYTVVDHRNGHSTNIPEQEMPRSALSVSPSTPPRPNGSSAATTSAWPAVVPTRGSSLEPQSSGRTPTETRFPQHLPGSNRSSGHEKSVEYSQDRIPRYATSALAAAPGGSTWDPNAHSRSTSAKDGRPSTAGSATARRQHLRLRSDTDDAGWSPDDVDRAKKSFDVLIDSDETLHYTLTPATAREVCMPAYGRFTTLTKIQGGPKPKVKSQTQELADFFRNTAPPGDENGRPKSSRSAKDPAIGLRSNPSVSPNIPVPINAKAAQGSPNAQQAVSSPTKPKNPLGEPRDPRMTRNTTRDLADYARSTGPENEMQLPKSLGARPATAQGVKTADQSLREKALAADVESRPGTTSGRPPSRLKYQARDARGPRTAESSDLIDFIREGPPRAAGEHRIDRLVAPFRTTMDSDDLNALAPPPELDANGRNSDGSAQESAVTVKSMPSSMNSRTGLLDSTNRASGKFTNGFGASGPVSRQPVIPEADGIPKRTRRKVRDPYAIDFSDEEEDMEELSDPPPRRTEEESLVDFLRNTAPPPGMITQPILAAVPNATAPDSSSTVKRSASSSKLKEYLQGTSSSRNGGSPKPANGARAESPHLTQVGSKMDKYRPTQLTHAAHVERNRQQKMRAEPRDASVSNGSGTADLAAYLKNSGPPPGSETPPQSFVPATGKDQAGFMKFFQRRASVRK